jgi:hypothetical protein
MNDSFSYSYPSPSTHHPSSFHSPSFLSTSSSASRSGNGGRFHTIRHSTVCSSLFLHRSLFQATRQMRASHQVINTLAHACFAFVRPRKHFTDPLNHSGHKETHGQAYRAHDSASSLLLCQTYRTEFALTTHLLVTPSLPSQFELASPHQAPLGRVATGHNNNPTHNPPRAHHPTTSRPHELGDIKSSMI